MTEVAEVYLGNLAQDNLLAQKVDKARESERLLEVNLQKSDRHKGRIFTQSTSGIALGIIKSRELKLQDGDVFQTTAGNLLLIRLEAETLMVLHFAEAINSHSAMKLVRLGHLLGNQHYPIKIEGHKIYVRLTTDKKVIIKMIEELNLSGLTIGWEQVSAFKDMINHSHHH
ncbi:Urease accessory protein UreE [Hyella patelloides LEGE 07179]|uniref:Urease accessory protein UreE n=1 Tax=Hyella patelloides LEGE 07179 TaxID=945734 RepID=A0A563VXW7_9CYAN|nr:urease accessory protein UreE [Hyella patelloides]VEP16260.1 Urease accessory protein UreE [Hyella patelloides LEGE 07179]